MCICVRGKGNLATANVSSAWGLHPCFVNLGRPKTVKAVIQCGADYLLGAEGNAHMIWKSPFHFPQGIANGSCEMRSDTNICKTQSAQSGCDLYSAGSWDGGRCQDLTSCLCVNGIGKWLRIPGSKLISLEVNNTQTWIEKFQPCDDRF